MKIFVLIFIFCWVNFGESLTCHHLTRTSIGYDIKKCSPTVNFCIFRKVVPQAILKGYPPNLLGCDIVKDCVENGRFSKPAVLFPETNGEFFCCDTDLCNTEENFKNSYPQHKEDVNSNALGKLILSSVILIVIIYFSFFH